MIEAMAGTIKLRVSELMGQRKWNITELAEKMGVSFPTASALYWDTTKALRKDTIAKLCEAFEVSPGELFIYEPDTENDGDH